MKTCAAALTRTKPPTLQRQPIPPPIPEPMLYTQTLEKLSALRVDGMARALEEQRRPTDITELDFEARLGLLVERQWSWKENRSFSRRLKSAQLKIASSLEDIDYRHPRGLKRAQIDQLRASQWIREKRNCLITGPAGIGKTYLACALGHQACRDGHRTLYYYAPKLFRALATAQADGSLLGMLKKLARAPLLIIVDLGISTDSGNASLNMMHFHLYLHSQPLTLLPH